MEIAKRLNAIIAQLLPCLAQEVIRLLGINNMGHEISSLLGMTGGARFLTRRNRLSWHCGKEEAAIRIRKTSSFGVGKQSATSTPVRPTSE